MDGGFDSSSCGWVRGLQEGGTAKPNRKNVEDAGSGDLSKASIEIESPIGFDKHLDHHKSLGNQEKNASK